MYRYLTAILLFVISGSSFGQEIMDLSFKQAITLGLNNNVLLKQAQNTLTMIEANKSASIGSLAPDISAFGQGWRADGRFFIEQEATVVTTVSDNVFGQLSANMLLFNGLSQINRIRREQHNAESQIHRIDRAKQNVIGLIAAQYLLVLQDMEQVKISEQNLENQKVLLDQINGMFEAGSRAITDKYDQEFQVKTAELALIRDQNRLRNNKAILAQTLLIPPSEDFTLSEPSWTVDDISLTNYDLDEVYQTALTNRGDFQGIKQTEEAARRNVSVSKGSYFPTLTGYFGWSSRYTDQTVSRDFEEQFLTDNTRKEFGVRLNIPIYSGLRNRATVVGAKVLYENAKLDVENQKVVVETEVLRAVQNFQDVEQAYYASLVQTQAAEKSLETQQESYQLGITSLIELSAANARYVEAKSTFSGSKYALLFQPILLDFALGVLKIDQIPD